MYNIELNNVRKDADFQTKVNKQNKAVEIFSAVSEGKDLGKFRGQEIDTVVDHLKELGERANRGDGMAKAEINAYVRFAMQPALQERINIFDFMGRFSRIGYADVPEVVEYKHNTRTGKQAQSGDVPLSTLERVKRPMATHTFSGGFAIDYREVASGNFDGIGEGKEQVKIDIHNKAMHHVIATLYNAIKNSNDVKYFAEAAGITKKSVDDIMTKVRRNGRPALLGDYAVASQLNAFDGFAHGAAGRSEAALEEMRQSGLLGVYSGSRVIEIPNQYDRQQIVGTGADKNWATILPEGLLFAVPQAGDRSPLQIVQRGDLQSATGFDITTGTELSRFDLELGAELVRPDGIGIISDSNFDAPTE